MGMEIYTGTYKYVGLGHPATTDPITWKPNAKEDPPVPGDCYLDATTMNVWELSGGSLAELEALWGIEFNENKNLSGVKQ